MESNVKDCKKRAQNPNHVRLWSGDIHILLGVFCVCFGGARRMRWLGSRALTLLHRITHHACLTLLSIKLLATLLALHLHSCPLHRHAPVNVYKYSISYSNHIHQSLKLKWYQFLHRRKQCVQRLFTWFRITLEILLSILAFPWITLNLSNFHHLQMIVSDKVTNEIQLFLK